MDAKLSKFNPCSIANSRDISISITINAEKYLKLSNAEYKSGLSVWSKWSTISDKSNFRQCTSIDLFQIVKCIIGHVNKKFVLNTIYRKELNYVDSR